MARRLEATGFASADAGCSSWISCLAVRAAHPPRSHSKAPGDDACEKALKAQEVLVSGVVPATSRTCRMTLESFPSGFKLSQGWTPGREQEES